MIRNVTFKNVRYPEASASTLPQAIDARRNSDVTSRPPRIYGVDTVTGNGF